MQIFKAEERTVRDILGKSQVQYIIPRNQREYTWEEKQWKELWIDINDNIHFNNNSFEGKDYFIGSTLFQQDKNNFSFNILDGQQRLTTFLIILSALYDVFYEMKQTELLTIYNTYILKKNDNGEQFFALKNPDIENFFEEGILYKGEDRVNYKPKNQQEEKIRRCYTYFYLKLKEVSEQHKSLNIDYLKAFRDQLLNLRIIEIIVKNELDGYTIFEILNARGKQLELADRMKNLILKRIPRTFPTDQAKIQWDTIKSNLDPKPNNENALSRYLHHYWTTTYNKMESDDDLYHDFKTKITSNDIISFLDDLSEKSKLYFNLDSPQEQHFPNYEIFLSINAFKTFRTIQVRPILLALLHQYHQGNITENQLKKLLRKLENFHFIFSAICNETSNKLEKIYYEYAPKIRNTYNRDVVNELFIQLIAKLPPYNKFEDNFIGKGYSNKNKEYKFQKQLINYIILNFERHYRNTDEMRVNNFTIEHIKGDDGTDKTACIGNLIPLDKKLNEHAENAPLKEKIPYYKNSELKSVHIFLEHHSNKSSWTSTNIEERGRQMAKLAYTKIWKFE